MRTDLFILLLSKINDQLKVGACPVVSSSSVCVSAMPHSEAYNQLAQKSTLTILSVLRLGLLTKINISVFYYEYVTAYSFSFTMCTAWL